MLGGSVPAELGEMDGRNAAAATVGLVNGELFMSFYICIAHKMADGFLNILKITSSLFHKIHACINYYF